MKLTHFIIAFAPLGIFALVACNGTTSSPVSENSNGNSNNTAVTDRQFTMPPEMKLMLGTVKLDVTEYAIDAEQASQLLPLWKALRSLGESETTAQAEIDALISQIEDTMTVEQVNAIDTMQLTMQDMGAVAETLGIEMGGFGGRMGDITPEMQATFEAARESGDLPGGGEFQGGGGFSGGDPGGGQVRGGGFGGAEMDPEARATAIAERGGTRGSGFGINTVLLDGIIQFLESKIQ